MKRRNNKSKFNKRNNSKSVRQEPESTNSGREERADTRNYQDCRSRDNDPSWYAQSPQIIRDFASLPFGNPLGSKLPDSAVGSGGQAISGIMTLYYTPTIGVADTQNSAINVAMRNIYSWVRHANSGHSNYDAPDLMLYLLAMDSIYMFHAWVKRLYGQLMLATTYNRYYPRALIESERVDYDDLQANIADFRGFINLYAVKAGALAVPNSMSYMARHTWMTEGLYVDDPSTPKAQTYKYVPENFLKFELDDQGAGSLTPTGTITGPTGGVIEPRKFADIVTLGNELLNPILANEDMNIMSGDILKAFGENGLVKITGITEDYMVLPSYSEEVLSQIENASVFSGGASNRVTQNTDVGGGYLVSSPFCGIGSIVEAMLREPPKNSGTMTSDQMKIMYEPYQGTRLLNMHMQDVPPDYVMVATRLMTNITGTGTYSTLGNAGLWVPVNMKSCGSEIISGCAIWTYHYVSGTLQLEWTPISTNAPVVMTPNRVTDPGESDFTVTAFRVFRLYNPVIAQLTQFNWHPLVYPTIGSITKDQLPAGTLGSIQRTGCIIGDLANYTTISEDNIENMHNIALLSEFSVPQVGMMRG